MKRIGAELRRLQAESGKRVLRLAPVPPESISKTCEREILEQVATGAW